MKRFFLLIAFFEILAGIVLFFAADKILNFIIFINLILVFPKC